MLFTLSKCLIVLFLHQVIIFFYPCRLKTQSTFICLSLPFASWIFPFAFQCGVLKRIGTFIKCLPFAWWTFPPTFQCGVLSKWYANSLTQIGLLLYKTKIHHHLNNKTSRFKKSPNQDLESSYVDYGLAYKHVCFLGCHP